MIWLYTDTTAPSHLLPEEVSRNVSHPVGPRFNAYVAPRPQGAWQIGRRPSLKRPALALARRKKALELLVACKSLTAIAAELNISVQSVRKHLRKALETDSLFPPSLDADQVAQLRQIEAERLIRLWEKTHSTLESVKPRIGTKSEKNLNVMAVARLVEAGTIASQKIAALYGLTAPTKVIEEQLLLR